jgi:uncharacterized CHY-type Zn-finger protein
MGLLEDLFNPLAGEEGDLGRNGIRGKFFNYMKNPFSVSLSYLAKDRSDFNFICPSCLKTILADNIHNVVCPYCDFVNSGWGGIFLKCPRCKGIMKYFECPYCHTDINLFADYNEEELKKRRYE